MRLLSESVLTGTRFPWFRYFLLSGSFAALFLGVFAIVEGLVDGPQADNLALVFAYVLVLPGAFLAQRKLVFGRTTQKSTHLGKFLIGTGALFLINQVVLEMASFLFPLHPVLVQASWTAVVSLIRLWVLRSFVFN